MDTPREISVVVLTRNRIEQLKQCINAIRENSTHVKEIIVIDNGSRDGTQSWLIRQMPHIEPIWRTDNSHGVIARNFGFDEAEYPMIAQVDDDVVVHKGWDITMLDHFKNNLMPPYIIGAVGVQGVVLQPNWLEKWPAQKIVSPGELADTLTGFCWMFRKQHKHHKWEYSWAMAPFWFEELELQMRMRAKANYKFKVTPMVCSHNCQRTEPVDWALHDSHLGRVRRRWIDSLDELHLEGGK